MDNEANLIKMYYTTFWFYLIATVILILVGALITILIFKNKISIWSKNKLNIGFSAMIIILLSVCFFTGYKFSLHVMDYKYVKNKDFLIFEGEMIGYTSIREGNSPDDPIYGFPVFRNKNTDEEVAFIVGATEIGKSYRLIYLPNTKIAQILD